MKRVKQIPLDKIMVEDIDPFLPKDQEVETKYIRVHHQDQNYLAVATTQWKVMLYYAYKRDSMMVSVSACNGTEHTVVSENPGARPSFNQMVEMLEKGPISGRSN